jgi:cell wall assembly regulator SMI1
MKHSASMKIDDSGPKLTEKNISEFEKQFNIKLPDDYRAFMLKNNGGTPEEDWAFDFVDITTNTKTDSDIQNFFVIYDEETYKDDDLRKSYRILRENGEVPVGILPIADDPGGNLICLSVSDKNYGEVFFCDHELEDPDTGYLVMSVIAESFSKFIDNCYSCPIEYDDNHGITGVGE